MGVRPRRFSEVTTSGFAVNSIIVSVEAKKEKPSLFKIAGTNNTGERFEKQRRKRSHQD